MDENIPGTTVEALIQLGHDVKDIRGTAEQGLDDDELWREVMKEKRFFITTDKSFTKRRNDPHFGILVIRLRQPNWKGIHDRVMRAMRRWRSNEWPGLLVVMRDHAQAVWRSKAPRK